jgi:hypothetical protein
MSLCIENVDYQSNVFDYGTCVELTLICRWLRLYLILRPFENSFKGYAFDYTPIGDAELLTSEK